MDPIEKHLHDLTVRSYDDLPDGAFLQIMREQHDLTPEDLAWLYTHTNEGYCLCVECIDTSVPLGQPRGTWNGPEEDEPLFFKLS